jgi:hypothetical protein
MLTHSVSKRTAKAIPQVESTILVEGIDKKVIKCKARKAFIIGNAHVKENETFFLVASEKRANRYYVVHYNSIRNAYQCSCGCNMCEHEHLKVVRELVMASVVKPDAPAMTVPATVAEVKASRKASTEKAMNRTEKAENGIVLDVTTQSTVEQWKAIRKADRKRQQAWQDEYRQKAEALREMEVAG